MNLSNALAYVRYLELIRTGLKEPYSPNHTAGLTTSQHVANQLQMVQLLNKSDFAGLQEMVANPKVGADKCVQVSDLENLLSPLTRDLEERDWVLLTAVVAFHDSGKLDSGWAADSHLCLESVEWIAHDFDSESILKNNPGFLEPFQLSDSEHELVLSLCRLHSLPGQYFFGEGNLSAYQPILSQCFSQNRVAPLSIARIQGVIDVMSALNQGMVSPILGSHLRLRELLGRAFKERAAIQDLVNEDAVKDVGQASHPIAWQRLQRLVGAPVSQASLPQALVENFAKCSDGSNTWFGTYVANAFGGGLKRALTKEVPAESVAESLMRVVVAAADFYQGSRQEWALSALQPALAIVGHPDAAAALLEAGMRLSPGDLENGTSPINAVRGETGVKIEFSVSG